jgi:hypothetical protein
MGLWAKSIVMFNALREHGTQRVRRLSERTGLSTSSVHRHLQAIDRRDCDPESPWWETEAGRSWLIRLVVAPLFVFGRTRGVGADTLRELFGRLHLEAHVGCSPNALRRAMHTLERLILETAASWEQEGLAPGEIRPVIGAVDATFLQRMMLVFMDLSRGYLLMEEVAVDRSYATWYSGVNGRLKTFGTEVLSLVSDRAKALVTLARTGLSCLSIPDVFHLSHELATRYSLAIFGRLRHANQACEHAKQRLEAFQNSQADGVQIERAQAVVADCETSVHDWQGVRSSSRERLSNLSRLLHPWRRVDSTRQTSQEVERQVHAELQALETLLATNGLPVKPATLDKVRTQLVGVSALVDVWWQTVRQDVAHMAMTPPWTQWVEALLLPLMDWREQRSRTRCPDQKAQLALVLQAVHEAFARHPCSRQLTPEVLAGWHAWAGEHARAFHRASSAVEGRNGSVFQMQPNHRGLPTRRSQVWTVLHNVDGRAADGTTPATRCFRRAFPDLFEHVLSQIDALPMPRQRRQGIAASH